MVYELIEVYMFWPNRHCYKIFEINCPIYEIYKYGLGLDDKSVNLTVPRFNWDGGFIDDGNNEYDHKTLANKDGYLTFNQKNKLKINLDTKFAKTQLEKLFSRFEKIPQRDYYD